MITWLQAAKLHAEGAVAPGSGLMDRRIHGWMFAIAIAYIERAAVAIVGGGDTAVQTYRKAVPAATSIRDMVTHFDAYIRGEGDLQKSGAINGFNIYIGYDGTTLTLHVADRTLDVASAYEAASALIEATLEELHADEVSAEYQKPSRPELDIARSPRNGPSE